jgi:4-amino-4-deoxy-L-arabinose transferase-like glycosyltransferase
VARRKRLIAITLVVALVSLFAWLRVARTARFFGDESGWISTAYYYTDLALTGDLRLEPWEGREHREWGSQNMQLAKWMLGVPLKLHEQRTGERFYGYYRFSATRTENRSLDRIPPKRILRAARYGMALVAAGTCVLLFLIGYRTQNIWAGVVAAALTLASKPGVAFAQSVADGPYVFFLVAGALACGFFLSAPDGKRSSVWAVICGVTAGLACSVKITGLVVGGGVFAACLAYRMWLHTTKPKEAPKLAALAAGTALLVTYALNPFLWPTMQDPHEVVMARLEADERRFEARYGHLGMRPMTRKELEPYASPYLRLPMMFPRWKRSQELQTRQGRSRWNGSRVVVLNSRTFGELQALPGSGALVIGGLAWAAVRVARRRREDGPDPWFLPLAFFLVNYAFILVLMPHNWDRYYLPTLVAGNILAALAIAAAAESLIRRRKSGDVSIA